MMKPKLHVPREKRLIPWLAAFVVGGAIWQALLHLASASGALSIYVAIIVGFNAYAFVAAGIAKPIPEEEEEGLFLKPY